MKNNKKVKNDKVVKGLILAVPFKVCGVAYCVNAIFYSYQVDNREFIISAN